ncbi:MAG: hypothetical protein ACI8ZB_000432 [Desulforhopalus sp.]|jgi:hypothetical protein
MGGKLTLNIVPSPVLGQDYESSVFFHDSEHNIQLQTGTLTDFLVGAMGINILTCTERNSNKLSLYPFVSLST